MDRDMSGKRGEASPTAGGAGVIVTSLGLVAVWMRVGRAYATVESISGALLCSVVTVVVVWLSDTTTGSYIRRRWIRWGGLFDHG